MAPQPRIPAAFLRAGPQPSKPANYNLHQLACFIPHSVPQTLGCATISNKDLQNAIDDVLAGETFRHAALKHGIPKSTLRNRCTHTEPAREAHTCQQRLSPIQEEDLTRWVVRQEALGYAPTHAQVRAIATGILKSQGSNFQLGKKWSNHFVKRHPILKTKLGRRTDWQRINGASPENINKLFDLYDTVGWIPPSRRYNA
jgi:hypothetical protein